MKNPLADKIFLIFSKNDLHVSTFSIPVLKRLPFIKQWSIRIICSFLGVLINVNTGQRKLQVDQDRDHYKLVVNSGSNLWETSLY